MLVDDDDVTLMICKMRLKKSNFCEEVITAENGEEAISYFERQLGLPENQRELPEIIFLDINMPIMNGWEFLAEFEKNYVPKLKHIKISILSSSVDPNDELLATEHPMIIGFITKPLTNEILQELKESASFKEFYPQYN